AFANGGGGKPFPAALPENIAGGRYSSSASFRGAAALSRRAEQAAAANGFHSLGRPLWPAAFDRSLGDPTVAAQSVAAAARCRSDFADRRQYFRGITGGRRFPGFLLEEVRLSRIPPARLCVEIA